ncbi:hypothetical protein [Nocardioides pantholopis]|uniref:hypothetical protein n=1 Tax=Nocardioides pantholopis TaxID=2483798 RepID=UPI000FD71990|nr:hypothetical protein [Nocardioides pantholopis]
MSFTQAGMTKSTRCTECNHQAADHSASTSDANGCSMGWCGCRATRGQVKAEGTTVLSPTFVDTMGRPS